MVVLKKKADGSIVKTNYNLISTTTTFNGLESFTEYIVEISAQSSLGVFSNAAKHEVKTDEGGMFCGRCCCFIAIPFIKLRIRIE